MNETHSNKFHRIINLKKNNTISITSYPNENEAEHSLFIINLDSSDINVEFIPVGAYTHPDIKVEFDDITSVTIELNNNESEEQNRIVQLNSSEMNNGSNDNIHQGLNKVDNDKTNFITDINEIKLKKQTNSLTHDRFNFGDKLYKCKICLKSFFDSTTLARHEIAHYGDVGDSLSNKTSVTIEPNNNESEEQNRIVQLNSSEMNSESNDNIHQGLNKVEHDKTNFISIDLNEMKLEKQTNSLKHERFNFGDKLYKCKICFKFFFDSTTLARHEIVHYGDVGDSLYKCDICCKAFFDSSDLAQHIRFHYKN